MITLSYKTDPACVLDLYEPEGIANPPVYVYFHGGGICGGDKAEGAALAEYLIAKGIAVASVNYRMYPAVRFPAFLEDAAAAVAFVQNSGKFSYITVGGSSAGAYISMMLYFNKAYLTGAGVDPTVVRGYFFNSGQPTSHFYYLSFEKQMDSRRVLIDEAAPLYYLDKPFAEPLSEPELLIACAENDMINRPEQNAMMLTALKQFGFPKDKLTYKTYVGESHCSYLKKEEYFEDTLALIRRCALR